MFSQASVILFTGLCDRHPPGRHPPGQTHPQGRHPPGQSAPLPSASWDTPHTQCKLGYTPCPPTSATTVDSTDPTGMHSCFDIVMHPILMAMATEKMGIMELMVVFVL